MPEPGAGRDEESTDSFARRQALVQKQRCKGHDHAELVDRTVVRKCLPTLVGDRFASVRIQDQAARRILEMMFSPMIVIKIKHVE
jgi:hypothetical protein